MSYSDVLSLPIRLRDAMIEQINEWRIQEAAAEAKAKRPR